jgi:hypothetical protein
MKKHLLTISALAATSIAVAQTQVTITIDTKEMYNVDCNLLGDGAGGPAQVNKVYMHSGACSENRGSNQNQSAEDYCADQIVPYASDVWQHVVGNWGANPQDDGVGEMTNLGNGVYSKTFVVEEYYSDPNLVSTEQNSTGTTVSAPLDPNNPVYLLGLVFRNEDGTASGRDQQGCQDIFVINFHTDNPQVINSTDNSACDFVTVVKETVGVQENGIVNRLVVGPNPVSDLATVSIDINEKVGNAGIQLFNTMGQMVYEQPIVLSSGKNNLTFPVVGIAPGAYVLSLLGNGSVLAHETLIIN